VWVDESGELIQITITESFSDYWQIKIIFQEVGLTTKKLRCIDEGGEIEDLVG
jgi:hypothetical protein